MMWMFISMISVINKRWRPKFLMMYCQVWTWCYIWLDLYQTSRSCVLLHKNICCSRSHCICLSTSSDHSQIILITTMCQFGAKEEVLGQQSSLLKHQLSWLDINTIQKNDFLKDCMYSWTNAYIWGKLWLIDRPPLGTIITVGRSTWQPDCSRVDFSQSPHPTTSIFGDHGLLWWIFQSTYAKYWSVVID